VTFKSLVNGLVDRPHDFMLVLHCSNVAVLYRLQDAAITLKRSQN